MGHQRTLSQYRLIDLTLFALMLVVFETVIARASTAWFPGEAWTVSLTAAVTAIVMVRWGPWAAVHAAAGGAAFCLAHGAAPRQYLIYCAGNCAALAVLPLVRKWGWERLKKDSLCCLFYAFLTLLAMQCGRAATAMILGSAPAAAAGFITTDTVSYIFTLVIVWIASRLDGILEDQKHYLARINDPDNREGGFR